MSFDKSLFHSFGLLYDDNGKEFVKFTNKQTENLSLERALEGNQNCWITKESERILKKKKILVSAYNNSNEERTLWLALLSEGFELYVFSGHLTQITPENLQVQLLAITPLSKKDLQTKIAELGLSQDETYLAGFNEIYLLIRQTISPAFKLQVSLKEIKNWLDNEEDKYRFENYSACEYITLFADDFEKTDLNPKLEKLLTKCLGLTLTQAVDKEGAETLLSCCHQLKCLDRVLASLDQQLCLEMNTTYDLDFFPATLETVNGSHNLLTLASMGCLLDTCQQLKTLNITDSCFLVQTDLSFPPGLEELVCVGTMFSFNRLRKMLFNLSNLKKLHCSLPDCKNLTEHIDIPLFPFSLEELKCSCLELKGENLQSILSNCDNLKKFEIINDRWNKDTYNTFFSCHANLNALEELTLSKFEISNDIFENLNISTQRLKKINFENCIFTEDFSQLSAKFSALKELNCSSTNITFSGLKSLLNQADVCEKLSIEYCKNLDFLPENFTLPSSLKELEGGNSKLTFDNLHNLLPKVKGLLILELSECANLGDIPPNFLLPASLEKLNLSYSTVTLRGLLQIVANCQQLKELWLEDCEYLQDEIPKSCPSLPASLETLNVVSTEISLAELEQLTWACTKLTNLNISFCKFFNEERSYSFPFKLTKLHINNSSISYRTLGSLLPANASIQEFNLEHCKNLVSAPPQFALPATIHTLNLYNQDLSFNDLKELLKNLPNLKKLKLYSVKLRGQLPDNFSLPASLESLTCTWSHISHSNFQQLIKNCTKLAHIDMPILNLTKSMSVNFSLPPSLKTLVCQKSELTFAALQKLLSKTYQLEVLKLDDCIVYNDEIPAHFAGPKKLKHLFCLNLKISASSLQYLVAAFDALLHLGIKTDFLSTNPSQPFFFPKTLKYLICDCSCEEVILEELKKAAKDGCPYLKTAIFRSHIFLKSDQQLTRIGKALALKHQFLDTATMVDPNAALTAEQFFLYKKKDEPHPSSYRLQVYSTFSIGNTGVYITNPEEKRIVPHILHKATDLILYYQTHLTNHPDCFLGKTVLQPLKSDWQVLPSLSSEETVLGIETIPTIAMELGRCAEEGLYYIKAISPVQHEVTVLFLLQVKAAKFWYGPVIDLNAIWIDKTLHQGLQQIQFDNAGVVENAAFQIFYELPDEYLYSLLIGYCKNFSEKNIPHVDNSPIAELNEILANQAGVCRHRTLAFMALASAFDLPARAIYNDIHAFVEIYFNEEWIMVDLGGASSNLLIEPFEEKLESLEEELPASEKDSSSSQEAEPEEKAPWSQEGPPLKKENSFQTWLKKGAEAKTWPEVIEAIHHCAEKNILCLIDINQTEAFYYHLIKNSNCPVYYLDAFDKVSAVEVVVDAATHRYHKKDSPLIHFLTETKKGGILLVNWSDYRPQHVGFNTILDTKRRLGEVSLPPDMLVLGLLDKNLASSRGEDFYSRFRGIHRIPSNLNENWSLPASCEEVPLDALIIPFYTENWQNTLFGRLRLNETGYFYEKSNLIHALEQGIQRIVFKAAPWHLEEFRKAIMELTLSKNLHANGQDYCLKDGVHFLQNNTPFSFEAYRSTVTMENHSQSPVLILNKATYHRFFMQYSCTENNQLLESKGLLTAHAGLSISLLITATLTQGQWIQLLDEAKKGNCLLRLFITTEVILPAELLSFGATVIESWRPAYEKIIETNDMDLLIQTNKKMLAQPTWVIPIDKKTSYADLVERMLPGPEHGSDTLSFVHQECVLIKGQKAGYPIILKGNASMQLLKELESLFLEPPYLFLNGKMTHYTNPLMLVCEKLPYTPFIQTEKRIYDEAMIWSALLEDYEENLVNILWSACRVFRELSQRPCFTYSQSTSMLNRLKTDSTRNPLKSILRLDPDYLKLKPLAELSWQPWNRKKEKEEHAISKEDAPINYRLQKVLRELALSSYLFITGPSGIGKSHFVQKIMKNAGYQVLEGFENLPAFLEPSTNPKLFFIDEANLYHSDDFQVFEGLLNDPPSLLINGRLKVLPKGNKLIFSGNFGHFKGRERAQFFEKHGNIITFKEFPENFLKYQVLGPLLQKWLPAIDFTLIYDYLCPLILNAYHKVNQDFAKTHSWTIRNLQSIALHLKPEDFQSSASNLRYALFSAIYEELHSLYTKAERQAFKDWFVTEQGFLEGFKAYQKQLKRTVVLEHPDFILTKKRNTAILKLEQAFRIRQAKMESKLFSNLGLSGIIFEGEAGIGKSLLAELFLQAKGFTKEVGTNCYYFITPTDLTLTTKTLLKAFHEGAVVIIDEMNTLSLESLLNPLLSGVDLAGKPAEKPGFFVIGTQNPISYANRQALSAALLNRFTRLTLKNYDKEDLLIITEGILKNKEKAKCLVEEYLEACNYAKGHQLFPEPNPRILFAFAATEQREIKKRKAEGESLQEGNCKRSKI